MPTRIDWTSNQLPSTSEDKAEASKKTTACIDAFIDTHRQELSQIQGIGTLDLEDIGSRLSEEAREAFIKLQEDLSTILSSVHDTTLVKLIIRARIGEALKRLSPPAWVKGPLPPKE